VFSLNSSSDVIIRTFYFIFIQAFCLIFDNIVIIKNQSNTTYKNVDNIKCLTTKYFFKYIMPGLMKLLDEHFKFLRLFIFEVQQNNMLIFQKYLIF